MRFAQADIIIGCMNAGRRTSTWLDEDEIFPRKHSLSDLHRISGCDDPGRKADVVFIHGLGGDPFSTWGDGESWPRWLGQEFPDMGVWSLGYAASPTSWTRFLGWFSPRWRNAGYSMSLPDRALQVLTLMVQRGVGERPLLFICHSLGGLLAKQVLRKSADATDPRQKQVAAHTRAILFLATPHSGAVLASLLNTFREVFGATVSIEDLREHDAHLRDLYNWFRNHAPLMGVEIATFYEMRGVRGLLPIVNPTSAHPGVGADPVPLDEDHLSIAKPRSRDALVCGAASDLLRRHVLGSRRTASPLTPQLSAVEGYAPRELVVRVAPATVAASEARRVPHELPPAAEQFFGRTAELRQLTDRLRAGKNTAVVGPAGMGKTALAAAAVRAVVGETFDAYALAERPFPDGVVFLDLYVSRGQAEAAWNTLANRLAGVEFMDRSPAELRAAEACRARDILVIVEGGEEADGKEGRPTIKQLFSVLSPENRRLLLTRLDSQAVPAERVELKETLHPDDAAKLFDALSEGRVPAAVRERVLELLEGHPLALTWAGNLLARGDDDPERLIADWQTDSLPGLSDPVQAEHTLEWLFERSVRGLDELTRQVLAAAGLLARAPFPIHAIQAAVGNADPVSVRAALRLLVQRGLLRRADKADGWEFTHVLGYGFARKETGSDPVVRERLGEWLYEYIAAALAPGTGGEGVLAVGRVLEHTAALLRADDDQRLWIPLTSSMLYEISSRLVALGRLDLVRVALSAVGGWMDRFPTQEAENPNWVRERAVLMVRQGDLLRDEGDLPRALVAYHASLTGIEQFIKDGLSDPLRQRDLGIIHNKVGDILRAQADLDGALASHQEALRVFQGLAAADPSNGDLQRELGVAHNKLGDVLRTQGDLDGAHAAYREGLKVIQRLALVDPSNVLWQQDLGVSHSKVGDVLREQGDLDGALTSHQESLRVRKALAATDSFNAGWQRDLSVSHGNVGHVLRDQGDLSGALTAYQKTLEVFQRLTTTDPSNTRWQRDLSLTLTVLAQVSARQGNHDDALRYAEDSLAIDEMLAVLDRTNAVWRNDVAVSRALVGRLRGQASVDG